MQDKIQKILNHKDDVDVCIRVIKSHINGFVFVENKTSYEYENKDGQVTGNYYYFFHLININSGISVTLTAIHSNWFVELSDITAIRYQIHNVVLDGKILEFYLFNSAILCFFDDRFLIYSNFTNDDAKLFLTGVNNSINIYELISLKLLWERIIFDQSFDIENKNELSFFEVLKEYATIDDSCFKTTIMTMENNVHMKRNRGLNT